MTIYTSPYPAVTAADSSGVFDFILTKRGNPNFRADRVALIDAVSGKQVRQCPSQCLLQSRARLSDRGVLWYAAVSRVAKDSSADGCVRSLATRASTPHRSPTASSRASRCALPTASPGSPTSSAARPSSSSPPTASSTLSCSSPARPPASSSRPPTRPTCRRSSPTQSSSRTRPSSLRAPTRST